MIINARSKDWNYPYHAQCGEYYERERLREDKNSILHPILHWNLPETPDLSLKTLPQPICDLLYPPNT
jgi:hypothetical protein